MDLGSPFLQPGQDREGCDPSQIEKISAHSVTVLLSKLCKGGQCGNISKCGNISIWCSISWQKRNLSLFLNLRSISEVLQRKKGRARDFGERLKALLQDAIQRWRAYHAGAVADFDAAAQSLRDALTYHLRNRCLADPDNQRLLNQIGRHHDRGNLLRFLEDPQIEPTNNRAERVLRPAVIARKVSQCSKNASGAYARAAFTSVIRTLVKTSGVHALVEGLYDIFQSVSVHAAPV